MGHVLEEADECAAWARYFRDAGTESTELMAVLCESVELCRIFGASLRTASSRPRDQRRLPNRRKAKHSGP
jgi:hypothetical protein